MMELQKLLYYVCLGGCLSSAYSFHQNENIKIFGYSLVTCYICKTLFLFVDVCELRFLLMSVVINFCRNRELVVICLVRATVTLDPMVVGQNPGLAPKMLCSKR